MKLWSWFRSLSRQEVMMCVVIVMLLIMIATRWGYISQMAGTAFRERFVPTQEQGADSTAQSVPKNQ